MSSKDNVNDSVVIDGAGEVSDRAVGPNLDAGRRRVKVTVTFLRSAATSRKIIRC